MWRQNVWQGFLGGHWDVSGELTPYPWYDARPAVGAFSELQYDVVSYYLLQSCVMAWCGVALILSLIGSVRTVT